MNYQLFDLRVPLGDGKTAVSMHPCFTDYQNTYSVFFADPEKLRPVIAESNRGSKFSGWEVKAQEAWRNLWLARIDDRKEERLPVNLYQRSVPMGHLKTAPSCVSRSATA